MGSPRAWSKKDSVGDPPGLISSFFLISRFNIWVCLKMSCTHQKPNGFADHYPVSKWLFHWGYTPFSDKSISFNMFLQQSLNQQFHIRSHFLKTPFTFIPPFTPPFFWVFFLLWPSLTASFATQLECSRWVATLFRRSSLNILSHLICPRLRCIVAMLLVTLFCDIYIDILIYNNIYIYISSNRRFRIFLCAVVC